MKIKVIPENTVGIPIIRPEKTADPPRCSAYALAEETIIKNENCITIGVSDRVLVAIRNRETRLEEGISPDCDKEGLVRRESELGFGELFLRLFCVFYISIIPSA